MLSGFTRKLFLKPCRRSNLHFIGIQRKKGLNLQRRPFGTFNENYYTVLGVNKTASATEIKKSYNKLVKKYHPDQNPSSDAKAKFQKIRNAYDILSKPEKRQSYDMFGSEAQQPDPNQGFTGFDGSGSQFDGSMFEDLFGFRGNSHFGGKQTIQGDDVIIPISLTFMEAVNGCKKELSYRYKDGCEACKGTGEKDAQNPTKCTTCRGSGIISRVAGPVMMRSTCHHCQGKGSVTSTCWSCSGEGITLKTGEISIIIPEGVENGTKVKVRNKGDFGIHGGARGHLYLAVETQEHSLFERDASDVHLTVDVSFEDAILGTQKSVPTLKQPVLLSIKPGTQPGEVVRMRGKGVKALSRASYGDQYVHFNVILPKKLDKSLEDLIKKYKELNEKKSPQKAEGTKKNEFKPSAKKMMNKEDISAESGSQRRKGSRTKSFFKRIFDSRK